MEPKGHAYQFICAVFYANVPNLEELSLTNEEGHVEVISLEKLREVEQFSWGYDTILKDYLLDVVGFRRLGWEFRQDYEKCNAIRLSPEKELGIWAAQEEWK